MSNVINLNQVRKRRAGAEKKRAADANSARHGRSLHERQIAESQAESERRRLDGHRVEPTSEDGAEKSRRETPPDPDAD